MNKMMLLLCCMLSLLCLPAYAASVDCEETKEEKAAMCSVSQTDEFTSLLLALPDTAFEHGVDGLSQWERKVLLQKAESETFSIQKKDSSNILIQNKYAPSSSFNVRMYRAEKRTLLCVYTANAANHWVICWQGTQQVSVLPLINIKIFLKVEHGFEVKDLIAQYPVQWSFNGDRIQATVDTWNGPLKDSDIVSHVYVVWHPEGEGSFGMKKEPLAINVE
ncbi:MAG: hypothetical protein Q9M28_10350 [Mariprofundaceae bacterium]|nr:hypothetical protein [Mariprofundaceae bacterium]